MDLGNAPEYARHSKSSGTDAGRQRVLGRDAGICTTWNFAALFRGDTPADVMESLIKELPRLILLQNQLRALVCRNWYHCSSFMASLFPASRILSILRCFIASRAGRHLLPIAPTLCFQSVSRHQAVPQISDRWGPSVWVLRHEIATGLGIIAEEGQPSWLFAT